MFHVELFNLNKYSVQDDIPVHYIFCFVIVMIVSLQEIKKHLYIDDDIIDDDDMLVDLIQTASAIVFMHLGWEVDEGKIDDYIFPRPIVQAVKLMVGELYAHREITTASSVNALPMAYEYLLSPYKNHTLQMRKIEDELEEEEPAPEEPEDGGLDADEVQQVQTALNEILS